MKISICGLLFLLLLSADSYGFRLDYLSDQFFFEKQTNKLLGTIKNSPEGFGCYAVRKTDWNILAEKRPYVFIRNDDGKGLLNIAGKDVLLEEKSFVDVNENSKNKKVKWTYKNGNSEAIFDLKIIKVNNDAYQIVYEGNLTISAASKKQTIPVKATCYD